MISGKNNPIDRYILRVQNNFCLWTHTNIEPVMYGEFNMWEDAKGASRRMNERGVEKTSCSFIEVNGVYLRFI
ncbi:hypothetical protein YC2023_043719 [Brassica napus]